MGKDEFIWMIVRIAWGYEDAAIDEDLIEIINVHVIKSCFERVSDRITARRTDRVSLESILEKRGNLFFARVDPTFQES